MASPDSKPRGYFKYLLAIDCETTGINYNAADPSIGHQAVSWGVIVANAKSLKSIEELYVEIKWNDESKKRREEDPTFGKEAEKIHKLTYNYLEKNGIEESEAVEKIGNLILKYWGPTVSIRTLGHNVHTFDLPFLRSMFNRHNVPLRFGNRHYDTNSIGWATFETFNSDDLFEVCGLPVRDAHNSLEDARYALESTRLIRLLFQQKVLGGGE